MTTILVASGGGHLQQLVNLVPRLGLEDDVVWVTPRTGLSEHLLRGQEYFEIPYSPPRDWRAAFRLAGSARRMLRSYGATRIISTGASPAPPFFMAGASLGLDLHYIESATRSNGPSLSGQLVSMLPSAHLYTQYPEWAGGRWNYAGSIFDPFSVASAPSTGTGVRRAVVTLGTEAFGFRRAVKRILDVLPRDAEVLWQTGYTDVDGLGIEGRRSVPGAELRAAIAAADVVISHAGTGSAITSFEMGKKPLLLPRESRFGEHVDDHQFLTANELRRRGLAISVPVAELSEEHVEMTRVDRVISDNVNRPFGLDEEERVRLIDLHMVRPRTPSDSGADSHRGPAIDLRSMASTPQLPRGD
jgi:UDP-N-acetylglucosamine--N-acetylmuramyl-(pentapeptide) pyrophosphoryl-undecaprenol N-acetylglucosamine transferase